MKKALLFLIAAIPLMAQLPRSGGAGGGAAGSFRSGSTLPATCSVAQVFYKTGTGAGQYNCTAANTWTLVEAGAGDNLGSATAADVVALWTTCTGYLANDGTCSVPTTVSGNAGTATALAANGANCDAGNYPLGVDASGAVESCTAVPSTHTQNTDTGTTATCFQLDNDNTGPKMCNSTGGLQVTKSDDTVLFTVDANGNISYGVGTSPWNLTGYTDDELPAAPGTANQFTLAVGRTSGLFTWIINGGATQYAASGDANGAATLAATEAYDATNWDSDTAPPQKDAVRDKFEALAPSGVVADGALASKYKTWQVSFKLWGSGTGYLLQATDDELDIWEQAQSARTITRVACKTDADATTLMLQKDDGSAADMFASAMTCNSTPSGTDGTDGILTSFVAGENALAQGVWLDALVVSIAGGTGHFLSITVSGTID